MRAPCLIYPELVRNEHRASWLDVYLQTTSKFTQEGKNHIQINVYKL